MKRVRMISMIGALALLFAACGSSDDVADGDSAATTAASTTTTTEATTTTAEATTTTTEATTTTAEATTTTTEATTTTAAAELSGLLITSVVFGDHVTITNHTDTAVSLDGMWLCNRPAYVELSGSLEPGESIDMAAGGLGGLTADGGEVGLYTSGSFGDSSAMTDYVAWGSGGGRTSVAEGAGLWGSGDSAPNDGAGVVRTDSAGSGGSWMSG